MLVLISDLHITDLSTAFNVNPEAFAILKDNILQTAANHQAKELHIVLLGDILDLVRTDYWLRSGIPMQDRPWGGTLDPKTALNVNLDAVGRQFQQILTDILATPTAQGLADMLSDLSKEALPAKATYIVGNHERMLWNLPALRRQIQSALPQIGTFARVLESHEYATLARHGHEWDVNCHGWEFRTKVLAPGEQLDRFAPEVYEVMTIGEAVTAELMGGLIYHARQQGASEPLLTQLKDVNNLRPTLDVFAWLQWLGSDRAIQQRQLLYNALKASLEGLLSSALAARWDDLKPDLLVSGDLVDRLQQVERLLLGSDFDSFEGRVEVLRRLQQLFPFLATEQDQLYAGAKREAVLQQAGISRGIQRVVYGHTHRARHDYLVSFPDGSTQMYINTGTFLPLITKAADGRSFASPLQMTMVYAYREDEDTAHKRPNTLSLDIWNGTRNKLYA